MTGVKRSLSGKTPPQAAERKGTGGSRTVAIKKKPDDDGAKSDGEGVVSLGDIGLGGLGPEPKADGDKAGAVRGETKPAGTVPPKAAYFLGIQPDPK